MSEPDLLGRVVVVVGDDPRLHDVAAEAARAGALVAVLGSRRRDADVHLEFRTDPDDPDAVTRVAAHVEQRLGPIDVVVTDQAAATVATAVFEPDLRRRGHGGLVVVAAGDDVAAVLSRLAGTR